MTSGVSEGSAPAALPRASRTSTFVAAGASPAAAAPAIAIEVECPRNAVPRGSSDHATDPPIAMAATATAISPYGRPGFSGGEGRACGEATATGTLGPGGTSPTPEATTGCLRVHVSQPSVRDSASFTAAMEGYRRSGSGSDARSTMRMKSSGKSGRRSASGIRSPRR